MPTDSKELTNYAVEYGTPAIGALLLLFVAWILARVFSGLVSRSLQRAKFDETLTKFFAKLVRWLVLIAAFVGILGMFGFETTSFAAIIGAAGLAVGLAFQGTLGNFAAGVMLLVFRPYKVGDVISAAGQTGKVDEIDLFTTTLDTPDNRRIIIPNGGIFGSTLENVSHHSTRRADIAVGVDYDADVDRTREVLQQAAERVEGRLEDPPTAIVLTELGASSVDWVVRIWCNSEDYWAVKEAGTRAVKIALDEAGIGIPYPQMDVHLDQPAG